jgi:N-carbamoylputrescine amidase
MRSDLGQIDSNLTHAADLADQAAGAGAEIIVLPELAACGYSLSTALWDSAEALDGTTVRWAQSTALRLRVYIGIGFVEVDGADFYNTYALAAPDGHVAGVVRKTMAETGLFRCATGNHVIQTDVGRIGIGICADNHFAPMIRLMRAQGVDLMLMPHAAPAAFKTGGLVSDADVASAYAKLRGLAPLYARLLGTPAVFANMVGPRGREGWMGIIGRLMPPDQFRFVGLSTIADRNGMIAAQLDDHSEGVIVGQVALSRLVAPTTEVVTYGRYGGGWLHAAASGNIPRDVLCTVDACFGRLSYTMSGKRRRTARAATRAWLATNRRLATITETCAVAQGDRASARRTTGRGRPSVG